MPRPILGGHSLRPSLAVPSRPAGMIPAWPGRGTRSSGRGTRSSSRGSSPSATASSRSRSRCWSCARHPRAPARRKLAEALWDQRENLLAYALSFAVIGRFWVVHHRFFSEVTGFDGRLLALNIFYLAWIVLIPFSSEVLGDHGGERRGHPLRGQPQRRRPDRDVDGGRRPPGRPRPRPPPPRTANSACARSTSPTVFLVSIPVAFVAPGLAPFMWLAPLLRPGRPLRQRASAPV